MRGQYSLFNSLLPTQEITVSKSLRKGRSHKLIYSRNTLLIHRYYYYAKINRNQYADIIESLSSEFFLSQERIIICLNQNHPKVKAIFAEEPDIKHLRNLYTWLIW